ncbi:MAG TPA: ABC transporter permease [Thermoanaerobaculia bacterium]
MSLPFQIAWRYLKRPADKLISAVGIVSVLGLVIGVMALVISMALMTGYRNDLEQKLRGGNAEIFVYAMGGAIAAPDQTIRTVGSIEGVATVSPSVLQQALVTSEEHSTGEQVMLKGIDPRRAERSPMLAKILGARRSLAAADGTTGIAIGQHLANKLRVREGDALLITVPTQDSGSFLPRAGTYVVTNVYTTGFFEFDARWLFIDLTEALHLLENEHAVNLLEVNLVEGADLERMVLAISERTGNRFAVTDWREMNRDLFRLLAVQQLVLFIVIGLIVFVSTFNIVSTLIMTVQEKKKEIGILISMGAERRFIRRIFIWYGTLVGVAGTATGIALGVLVSYVITRFELVSFGPEIAEVYFVSSIPFINRWTDLTAIAGFAIVVAFFATLIPSARAARLNVIDALRYE